MRFFNIAFRCSQSAQSSVLNFYKKAQSIHDSELDQSHLGHEPYLATDESQAILMCKATKFKL